MDYDVWSIAEDVICAFGGIALVFLVAGATYSFIQLLIKIASWF